MSKKKIVFDEAVQIIEAEIGWCENESTLVNDGYVTQEFHNGFVNGLNQAIHLLSILLGTDAYLRFHGHDPAEIGSKTRATVDAAIAKTQQDR